MARTNAQTRAYVEELIHLKTEIDNMNVRRKIVAEKLGRGTWRSKRFPGIKVLIGFTSAGWRVGWQAVAKALARRLGMSDRELEMACYGHRTRTYGSPSCSVSRDKSNRLNPNLKAA